MQIIKYDEFADFPKKEELDSVDPTSKTQGAIFTALSKHFSTYGDLLRPASLPTPQKDDL